MGSEFVHFPPAPLAVSTPSLPPFLGGGNYHNYTIASSSAGGGGHKNKTELPSKKNKKNGNM
jgi:hypothetical protein